MSDFLRTAEKRDDWKQMTADVCTGRAHEKKNIENFKEEHAHAHSPPKKTHGLEML